MKRRTALRLAIGVAALAVLPLLGGSMIWYAGGARRLDIDGAAGRIGRPAHTIEIGHGWSHYGGDAGGGLRPGDNCHANAVVALEVATGELRWSFQTVHHDVWDYDVPAQPGLYSVWRDGRLHDVVAQVTKMGFVFVLDRATGEPFLPIEERPVVQIGAAGEALSPTQPFPAVTPPLVPSRLSPDDAFGIDATQQALPDAEVSTQTGAPFGMKRELLLSPLGIPCTPPPWGVLAGVDLARGDIVWRKTLGAIVVELGTPNLGGPIVTAGGLVFIGATMDNALRAFDVTTGEERWKGSLPAPGFATPMTYVWEGRQYVVIYAGGNAITGLDLGDTLIAFALPDQTAPAVPPGAEPTIVFLSRITQ